jgi:hypothetical protein
MKAKDNEGGMEYGPQTVANSTSMTNGGDISSAQVATNVNDGELELSAESTIPHKPALRGKWSKIPIRLGSSLNNVGIEGGSSSQAHTSTNDHVGVDSTKRLQTSKGLLNGDTGRTTALTTIKHASDAADKRMEDHNGLNIFRPSANTHASSHEEKSATTNNDEEVELTKLGSGNAELRDAPIASTNDVNESGSSTGIGSSERNRERSGSGGSVGLSKHSRSRSSSINKTTSSTNLTSKTSSHGTISDATIANADALAYFPDDMIDINLIGVKHVQRAGHPLHLCSKCDVPIAVYGRLV